MGSRRNPLTPGRARDMQRQKLYRAERAIHSPPSPTSPVREVAGCQRYIDAVISSAWMAKHYPRFTRSSRVFPVRVKHGGGGSSARAYPDRREIALPLWSRQPAVILHELAHLIVHVEHGDTAAWHGWQFAACHLALVRRFMGKADADKLRASFKANRVRYTKPRTLSPEARAAAAARLAQYRRPLPAAACTSTTSTE